MHMRCELYMTRRPPQRTCLLGTLDTSCLHNLSSADMYQLSTRCIHDHASLSALLLRSIPWCIWKRQCTMYRCSQCWIEIRTMHLSYQKCRCCRCMGHKVDRWIQSALRQGTCPRHTSPRRMPCMTCADGPLRPCTFLQCNPGR